MLSLTLKHKKGEHAFEMIGGLKKFEGGKYKDQFLSVDRQVKAWRKANRKMKWGIPEFEFHQLPRSPELTGKDLSEGFRGVVLSYG